MSKSILILMILKMYFLSQFVSGEALAGDKQINFADKGSLIVETLEFRDLTDTKRPHAKRAKTFAFFGSKSAEQKNPAGRLVPIKVHLPQSGGPYPIIVISHGAGGDWNTHDAQATHLASHGFAVLNVEHVGSNTDRLKASFRLRSNLEDMIHDADEVLGRPKDLGFALDQAEKWNRDHAKLKDRLNVRQVGMLGHSFGAFTVMVAAGMRPALDWIVPPVSPGKGLGPDLSDGRAKCAVALSPQAPGEPFFLPESYASLQIPMLGISGTEDKQFHGEPPSARYDAFKLWPAMQNKNYFLWLDQAAHLDFTDASGRSKTSRDSPRREPVQRVVRAAILMFFNQCLKGDATTPSILSVEYLRAYEQSPIRIVDLRVK